MLSLIQIVFKMMLNYIIQKTDAKETNKYFKLETNKTQQRAQNHTEFWESCMEFDEKMARNFCI